MSIGHIAIEVRAANGETYGYGAAMPFETFLRFDGGQQADVVEFLLEGLRRAVIKNGTWVGPDAEWRGLSQ